jgi:hypothetical protein
VIGVTGITSHFSRPIVIVTDVDDTTAELNCTRFAIAATVADGDADAEP